MKKILFLGGLRSGGAEHQMVTLARLLKRDGYDVSYLSTDKSDFFLHDLESAGIPLIRLKECYITSLLKLNIPRTLILLYKTLRRNKYDTVISFLTEWNFFNCLLANSIGAKHKAITGIRNNRDEVFLSRREKFYAKFERNSAYKVSNSCAAKKKYAQYYPNIISKLTVIYNVVELPSIHTTYQCRKDGKTHIVVPASYRAVKNPMRMLEAVSLLSLEERSKLHIDWYGNIKTGIDMYTKMQEFIRLHNLAETIILHDATSEIANHVNEADFVALFSTSEGLPNAICEGMMLGKPVIMTTVSDYQILVDESNGFLCDPMNVDTIKSSLAEIVSLPNEDILKMGLCSRLKAHELFSEEKILQQWKEII